MDVLQPGAAVPVLEHYRLVAPLLQRRFAGIPIVAASFPRGFSEDPDWLGPINKPLPHSIAAVDVPLHTGVERYVALDENALLWLIHRYGAIEFHSWSPTQSDPMRAAFGRILLELEPGTSHQAIPRAAQVVRETLLEAGLEAIPVLAGASGLALWLPFSDAPSYPELRCRLHDLAQRCVERAPDLLTTDPVKRLEQRVHLHVSSNAPGRFSALPYTLRADAHYTVCAPLRWDEVAQLLPGSVDAGNFAQRLADVGDVFDEQCRELATQRLDPDASQPYAIMATPATQPQRGHMLSAVLDILSDGIPRSADDILAEALKRKTLPDDTTRKYVYTAIIEYIARTEGRKRKPLIVQDPDRRFRINEPPDAWPAAVVPQPAPAAGVEDLCARLEQSSHGDDPTAFEQAVCDAFTAFGFAATHVGGNDAPDGYADAVLGPLQYRVMIECKTARSQVTQPDCFEASKYREAYHADYCIIAGPEFSGELELVSELQTHGVSAWSVADLQQLLRAGAAAFEMRELLQPGFASDSVGDLLWSRQHGSVKRLSVICSLLRSAGWSMQLMAAQGDARADAAAITVDVAIALVDAALSAKGTHVGCTRGEITDAFAYLTSPLTGSAMWADERRDAIIIVRE